MAIPAALEAMAMTAPTMTKASKAEAQRSAAMAMEERLIHPLAGAMARRLLPPMAGAVAANMEATLPAAAASRRPKARMEALAGALPA